VERPLLLLSLEFGNSVLLLLYERKLLLSISPEFLLLDELNRVFVLKPFPIGFLRGL